MVTDARHHNRVCSSVGWFGGDATVGRFLGAATGSGRFLDRTTLAGRCGVTRQRTDRIEPDTGVSVGVFRSASAKDPSGTGGWLGDGRTHGVPDCGDASHSCSDAAPVIAARVGLFQPYSGTATGFIGHCRLWHWGQYLLTQGMVSLGAVTLAVYSGFIVLRLLYRSPLPCQRRERCRLNFAVQ